MCLNLLFFWGRAALSAAAPESGGGGVAFVCSLHGGVCMAEVKLFIFKNKWRTFSTHNGQHIHHTKSAAAALFMSVNHSARRLFIY